MLLPSFPYVIQLTQKIGACIECLGIRPLHITVSRVVGVALSLVALSLEVIPELLVIFYNEGVGKPLVLQLELK